MKVKSILPTQTWSLLPKILATPEARDWNDSFGADPGGETPEALAALVRVEHAKLGEVIRAMGIKAE